MSSDAVKGNPVGGHFNRAEWFALPLAFRQRWWRETYYSKQPPPALLLLDLRVLLERRPPSPPAADLRGLKAAMAAAHPDRGGSSTAFVAAHAAYVTARRRARERRP